MADISPKQVGPQGYIIGVDLTAAMLAKAHQRIQRKHWSNVTLIKFDAAAYKFPRRVDAIISTFVLTLVPEYDRVIKNAASASSTGKRLVILDFKMPEKLPMWLVRLFVILTRPYGVTLDLGERHLWESIGLCELSNPC